MRGGADIADEKQRIGAGRLQPRQLRNDVDIVVLEFFNAGRFDVRCLERSFESMLVGFAPRIVHQNQAGLLGAVLLDRVLQDGLVDILVHRRNAEDVVVGGAVVGDVGAGGPWIDEGHLGIVDERHDGHGHRRIEPADQGCDLFTLDQFARGQQSLRRIAFVVAADEFERATEHAALGIDFFDGDGCATSQRFTGASRLSGQCSDKSDLDRVRCKCSRCCEKCCGKCRAGNTFHKAAAV